MFISRKIHALTGQNVLDQSILHKDKDNLDNLREDSSKLGAIMRI